MVGHAATALSSPDEVGFAKRLYRQIRKRPSSSYTYVILLTSHEGTDSVVEGLDAGADDFITKPFQPEELHVRLRTGERVISLESRDVTIFALAKLADHLPERGLQLIIAAAGRCRQLLHPEGLD